MAEDWQEKQQLQRQEKGKERKVRIVDEEFI